MFSHAGAWYLGSAPRLAQGVFLEFGGGEKALEMPEPSRAVKNGLGQMPVVPLWGDR